MLSCCRGTLQQLTQPAARPGWSKPSCWQQLLLRWQVILVPGQQPWHCKGRRCYIRPSWPCHHRQQQQQHLAQTAASTPQASPNQGWVPLHLLWTSLSVPGCPGQGQQSRWLQRRQQKQLSSSRWQARQKVQLQRRAVDPPQQMQPRSQQQKPPRREQPRRVLMQQQVHQRSHLALHCQEQRSSCSSRRWVCSRRP